MGGGGQITPSPIDFHRRPYNTLALPCERVILVDVLTILCQFTQQQQQLLLQLLGRRRGVVVSGVLRMNEVNARRARLVLGWVTVFGRVYHLSI